MTLQIRQELIQIPGLETKLRLVHDPMGRQYDIFDYWEHQPKHEVTLTTSEGPRQVQFVYAPPSWLNYVSRGEKFGAYVGDMMFISSDQKLVKPDWVPFIIVKLYGERFLEQGLDESGRAKHYESLFRTIRAAAARMDESGLHEFLSVLVKHDRERYFELDAEAREFLERNGGDPKGARRAYLDRHHGNKWVGRGRLDEQLMDMGCSLVEGYRNHAEAVLDSFGDLDARDLYLAAQFIHTLNAVEPEVPVVLEPPYTSFAFNLTKDGNGKVDLVRFRVPASPGEDIVVKVKSRQPTWTALGKRFSYRIHKVEESVGKLISTAKQSLDGILIEAKRVHESYALQIAEVKTMVSERRELPKAQELFKRISGEYAPRAKLMDEVTQAAAQNLRNLEELSELLRDAI